MKTVVSLAFLALGLSLGLDVRFGLPGPLLEAAALPNVLVFVADDQGWGDLSSSGNRNLATPHVDSLARDGASFDRFFVCPVCSPTRAELLTGRYHPRGGVQGTSAGGERLDLDETTIAQVFKAAGYSTGAFGKWHNGMQYPYHPNGRGFDEFYGFCSGHWGDYFSPPLDHNGEVVRGSGFVADDFTEHAMEFLATVARKRTQPFFAYLAYNTPHSPMQVPERWWEAFASKELAMRHRQPDLEDLPHTRAALAMCENIDWNVGRVLEKLAALGIERETIVVYLSDNGPNGFRWNGGMKGRKGSTDEGGVRSPLYLRWPGRIAAGGRIAPIAAAIDLLPTLADLAGVELPRTKPLDGVSLRPLLLGAAPSWPDRRIFSHWGGRVSVRTDRYRLDDAGRLFDMVDDPGQMRDVAGAHADVARELRDAVARWRAEVLSELRPDERPFLVGHSGRALTQLPARDAQASGGVQRSNRFPNSSYFESWASPDDRITWQVEVLEKGRFEAELYQTCPESAVGSRVELSFGPAVVSGTIREAYDPPVRGAEHDRVPRQESYVKDFRPWSLGTIDLPSGRGVLTLRLLDVVGAQGIDVSALLLRRTDRPRG